MATVVFCVGGCSGPGTVETTKAGEPGRIDTPRGMIEYLKERNLPALKSVEVWQNEYGPGLKLSTAHYDIFTTLLEPLMLSKVPGFLESAYRSYNGQLSEPIEAATKFPVYLFAERMQWEDFTKAFAGRQASMFCKIKAGAYYLNGACVAYNIGRERTFSALGHEGWHQFNKRLFQFRLPSWLDEGIAMLFEVSRESGGFFYFEPGKNIYRLGGLKKTLMDNEMIPLRELIAVNPGEVLSTEKEEAVMAFYSQSYALVRFLREEDYGKRLWRYHRLLLDGLRGNWLLSEQNRTIAADRNIPLTVRWNRAVGLELFEHYIGDDFDRIGQEYAVFCRKIVYHVRLK
ncbi:MAG: hypothetical protein JSV99_06280 [Planctomycetota bacterium]|nr:MAG: hypothetical protein JSV99_06280 [Planctomycetota bacterium]